MWTTPPIRIADWGLAATTIAVVLVVALIAAVWARGDTFGQRCRAAGHGDGSEGTAGLHRCVAQLAKGRRRAMRQVWR